MTCALVLACAFVVAHLAFFQWDASRFVLAGEGLSDPGRVPKGLYVIRASNGYDGQAFYRLALDPLTREKRAYGITLDTPPYRQQRIGYPVVTWLVSGGGDPRAVPWALIVINTLALGAIGWIGGALASAVGRHAGWGAIFALHPGFVFSLARDLSEPLAAAFMLAGLLLLRRSRASWAALALTAAALTRETTVVVPAALAIVWVIAKVRRRPSIRAMREFVVPLAVFAAWQMLLWSWWGTLPATSNENATDVPFVGLIRQTGTWLSDPNRDAVHQLLEVCFLLVLVVSAIVVLRSGRVPGYERLALAGAGASAALLSVNVWIDHAHFLRAVTELYLLSSLIVLAGWPRKPKVLLVAAAALTLALGAIFARNL